MASQRDEFDDEDDYGDRPRRRRRDEQEDEYRRRQRRRNQEDDDDRYSYGESRRGPREGGIGLAVTGMVLGILAFVFSFIPCVGWFLGVLLGILGAIFSGIGIASPAKGMAIAGLVLSILAILWIPIFWLLILGAALHI